MSASDDANFYFDAQFGVDRYPTQDCPACGQMHQITGDEAWCDDCGDFHPLPVTVYDVTDDEIAGWP